MNTPPFSEGQIVTAPYPFTWEKTEYTEEYAHLPSEAWRPGVRFESLPPFGESSEAVCDGIGSIELTIVGVFKPGRFPTRVFFTRRWIPPTGQPFGRPGLRIATLEKFRRLARGYAHPYSLRREAA